MDIDYARVSTDDWNLALQTDALKAAGCDKIYMEKISGAKTQRPELARLLIRGPCPHLKYIHNSG